MAPRESWVAAEGHSLNFEHDEQTEISRAICLFKSRPSAAAQKKKQQNNTPWKPPRENEHDVWDAVRELNLSYHNPEALLFTIRP